MKNLMKRCSLLVTLLMVCGLATADVPKGPYPPALPGGKAVVTDTSADMLKVPDFAKAGITNRYVVAKEAPTIDFMYYPGQNHIGNPWSDWGDGTVASNGKFYSAIGDHKWEAYVYEYDPTAKNLKMIADVKKFLTTQGGVKAGEYTPGKIHAMVTMGKDGWVYYCTHRGSDKYTLKTKDGVKYNYHGDWVLKTNPETGETKVVAQGPIPDESLPAGRLDPERMIFYGGTAEPANANPVVFFALDASSGKVLAKSNPSEGYYRYGFISKSTGKFYWQASATGPGGAKKGEGGPVAGDLWSYDPATNKIQKVNAAIGLRTASDETPQGVVWTLDGAGWLFKFDCKTEKVENMNVQISLGGSDAYHGTIDASPDGRYLYTLGGAHGGASAVGCPVTQYDTKTKALKVIAFLNPYYTQKYNYIPDSTFGSALSADGSTMFITVNGTQPAKANTFSGDRKHETGASAWYVCSLFAIHIPEGERKP